MTAEDHQRELEKRVFHLKTLYDTSREIAYLRNPDDILKRLLIMTMGAFGSFTGVILMTDLDGYKMQASYERGLNEGALDSITLYLTNTSSIEPGSGKRGGRIKPPGDGTPQAPCSFLDLLAREGIRIWVPFREDGEISGGIGLGEKLSEDPYTEDDEELLTTILAQGEVSIHNAKLIQKMKEEETVRTNLARYLPPDVVEQVIQNKIQVDLGGDRKGVTILFSDIRKFTQIAESEPPDKLIHILNEYFTAMAQIIFDNQGSLDNYIGDAIVAVFGSLIPLENAASNAAAAAIDMMNRLAELNDQWLRNYDGFTMDIGIGINTGEVFLGNIGSPERMVFTVIGDAVNVASRFSGIAKAGQILATSDTFELISDLYDCVKKPSGNIKGKTREMDIYEIRY